MKDFKPDLVFHAAALKHVPILERDWSEGVKTNIFGSINVADAALAAGAEAMVMISTDKAIEPVSMLGLTKRFAEMYCQALDHDLAAGTAPRRRMRLISVRFGNVLASNGSVVPKFKAQIEAGGPVTVTHPDMVRYFMTIREACDLVITAATHALAEERGHVSVYVLNMGQPVKIVDLAERMIRLSGLQPGHDIEIVFSGIRPGERLHEILFANEEPPVEIGVAGIMAAKPNEPPMQTLRKWIAALEQAIEKRRSRHHQDRAEGCGPGIRLDRRLTGPVQLRATPIRKKRPMPGKVVIISQHYPPDPSTTAAIMAEIAGALALDAEVLVLSGTPGSGGVADGRGPACGRRDPKPDRGKGRAVATRGSRSTVRVPRLRRTAAARPTRRRRAHRHRAVHAALCERRGCAIEGRPVGPDHARSVSGRACDVRLPETCFDRDQGDPLPPTP